MMQVKKTLPKIDNVPCDIVPNSGVDIHRAVSLTGIGSCTRLLFLENTAEIPDIRVPAPACGGYTLVELLVALAVTGVLLAAVCLAFGFQQKALTEQGMSVDILQSSRAALNLMQHDIRMAGFDATWKDTNDDQLDDRRLNDLVDNDCDGGTDKDDPGSDENENLVHFTAAQAHYVQFRLDRQRDGDICDPSDLIGFGFSRTRDRNQDGIADAGAAPLGRSVGASGLQPLAEDIQAVAFGFAFDDDNGADFPDGDIDTATGNILWGYDANGDGYLDTRLDSNKDGLINAEDDLNGDGRLNDADLTPAVPIRRVRAVAIWMLARTRAPLRGRHDTATYVVGNKIIIPLDRYKRELMTAIVYCRNLGLR